MKPFRRFNTIFYKLIFSYSVLTVLITAILGFTASYYSSAAINSQIVKLHEKMLEYLKNEINITVLNKVNDLYINLSVGKYSNADIVYLFDNPASKDYAKINSAYNFLKALANSNSDMIDSIYLYYPGQKMLLSSSFGVKFLDEESREVYTQADWFKAIGSYAGSTIWIGTRKVPGDMGTNSASGDILTYIHSYPYTQASNAFKGFIIINVKESALSQRIRDIAPDEYKDIYILGPTGRVISAYDSSFLYKDLGSQPYVQHIIASGKQDESALQKVDGATSMVSFTSLPPTDWKLVNTTSVDVFYRQSAFMQRVLVIICVSVIVLGLIISTVFTSYMYNPWKIMINRIKSVFKPTKQVTDYKYSEVGFINEIVNELSVKVNELQDTLEMNRPLIKHNLVTGLLNNRILTKEQFEENIRLIPGLSINKPCFSAMLIELDPATVSDLSMENNVFMRYNTIKNIEAMSNDEALYLAAEYSGDIIGIIQCAGERNDSSGSKMLSHIMGSLFSNFKIESTAVCGKWEDDILEIHESFAQCLKFLKYRFYLPRTLLLVAETLAGREASKEALPGSLLDAFSKSLNNRDIDAVMYTVEAFSELVQSEKYSADQCSEQLQGFIHLLGNYIKNIHYPQDEADRPDLQRILQSTRDVDAFKDWITGFCRSIFSFVEMRISGKNTEVVAAVKEYVGANLQNDISLDILATKFHLSAHYISKLFKEETGINLIDYITLQRIEKAKCLLGGTDLTIKEIADKVGYDSPAYFIKKFKEITGDTPLNYKRLIEK